jgi:mannose-6-phosphate isomerase-like protein (cupin superfamily)
VTAKAHPYASSKDEGKHVTISPTADDIAVLRELIHAPMCSEHFEKDTYLNQLIPKPWGYEHRVYADNIYDVWTLNIRSGGRTSLHCHPRKDTTLLCLAGTGVFKTLIQERRIRQGDYLHIRKGAFHSTQNSGISMLELLEVESPE